MQTVNLSVQQELNQFESQTRKRTSKGYFRRKTRAYLPINSNQEN